MQIVIATGIYPPDVGGPATYAYSLAKEFRHRGIEVVVVAYGERNLKRQDAWRVEMVDRKGGPIMRWMRYRKILRRYRSSADVVLALCPVSVGIPLLFSGIQKKKKYLRLGGDFIWERYIENGGEKTLRDFYNSTFSWGLRLMLFARLQLLRQFSFVIFSTYFQKDILCGLYKSLLPNSVVIENALPLEQKKNHTLSGKIFHLVFLGRLVACKNLFELLKAIGDLPHVHLDIYGDGPLKDSLASFICNHGMEKRICMHSPIWGDKKQQVFDCSDALILPSISEVSPNIALEALASGLPVILTAETGLSVEVQQGMFVRNLQSEESIRESITDCLKQYDFLSERASLSYSPRYFSTIASDFLSLVQ